MFFSFWVEIWVSTVLNERVTATDCRYIQYDFTIPKDSTKNGDTMWQTQYLITFQRCWNNQQRWYCEILSRDRAVAIEAFTVYQLQQIHAMWSIQYHRRRIFKAVQWYGYGSKPMMPYLGAWTSIYHLFWCSLGARVLTHCHIVGQQKHLGIVDRPHDE